MTARIHGHKTDYWGRVREIVSLDDYLLVRPIAKELNWKISEAINFKGVDRRYILSEQPNGRTRFTIAKEHEAAFRVAGLARTRSVAERHEKRLREDAAYQKRVQREAKQNEIYTEHRRETAAALTDYQSENAAADTEYGEDRMEAGERAAARKSAAVSAYNEAIQEADEDRDEALKALMGDD